MKKNRSDIEFYQNMMDMLQQEKASLKQQLDAERKSRKEESELMLEENRALRTMIAELTDQLRDKDEKDRKKDAENKELINRILSLQTELSNALAAVRLGRGKRFAPSSEKRSRTDDDRTDRRAREKDDFDGTPPAGGSSAPEETISGSDANPAPPKQRKKKSEGRKESIEEYVCDEVVRHELDDYFKLPEGAVFKTRNGQTETHEYVSYELGCSVSCSKINSLC